jgi:hypothetical protein
MFSTTYICGVGIRRGRSAIMRRTLSVSLTVLLIAALGLSSGPQRAAAATTWIVDDDGVQCPTPDYSSIQAAINASTTMPGDTIQVCPGLYNEMVTINKNNLTLLGALANVDARTRPFVPDPSTQSIIENVCSPVRIIADNVVLNGFTIQGSTVSDPCTIAGIWMNPGSNAADVGGAWILYDTVQANIAGIELDSTCAARQTRVQYNLIQNNDNPGPGSGNGIETNFGLCNALIDSNKFSGHVSSSDLVVVPSSNLTFTNNELVAGTPEGVAWLFVTNGTISGNVSTGSTSSGTIDLFGGDSGIAVTGNTLLNGVRAIVVENPYVIYGVPQNTSISAHQNCIQGNVTAGMEVDPLAYPLAPQLNAESNWWGSPSGPNEIPRNTGGTGDKIIDQDQNVDFDPWLPAPTAAPCPALPTPQKGPKDLVAGTGTINFPNTLNPMVHVNASRNPNTMAVNGHFYIRYPDQGFEVSGRVTCLTVTGNKAGVGGVIERVKGTSPGIFGPTMPGNDVLITVLDMGEPGTFDQVNEGQVPGARAACPSNGSTLPINQGNYVVKSDPPDTSLLDLDALIAGFESAAGCASSLVCSGVGTVTTLIR